MVKALERSLGKKLVYEKDAGFKSVPQVAGENRKRPRPVPRKRKTQGAVKGKRKSPRSRAVAFDFGLTA